MRTQVAIVGAGPAGLLLSHLLHLHGVDSVVLEARSREYVEQRIRAGLLEQGTEELLANAGVGGRMRREGMRHEGIRLRFAGRDHRVDFRALTGRHVMIYSQHKIVQDLIAARLAAGGEIVFDAEAVAIHDLDGESPRVTWRRGGQDHSLACKFIAGCDGFHGVCRPSVRAGDATLFEREYPFGWLGILAEAAPSCDELVYASHERGFALLTMRSPTVSRLYLQCAPDEYIADWSDDRIWHELRTRTALDGFTLNHGPIIQKGVTPMRSFVVEPMQFGRLFLVGDAAHIVPPTGAKGLNLAVADVAVLTSAVSAYFTDRRTDLLDAYSATCLSRVWKVQRFSWWMTTMLHRFPDQGAFDRRVQMAEQDYVTMSTAASTVLAENYVGLPLE
ncbi:MAG TPA: 4-hydroxybenzoate 3-monooxygenase [Acetobacteraceae bacterium]